MAQSKTTPAGEKKVKELHGQLVEMLSGERRGAKPDDPYWDASSTTFQDDFKARVDELLETIADQPDADRRSAPEQTSG